jgi:hypothetical protein
MAEFNQFYDIRTFAEVENCDFSLHQLSYKSSVVLKLIFGNALNRHHFFGSSILRLEDL